jgi:hypothetical protein
MLWNFSWIQHRFQQAYLTDDIFGLVVTYIYRVELSLMAIQAVNKREGYQYKEFSLHCFRAKLGNENYHETRSVTKQNL